MDFDGKSDPRNVKGKAISRYGPIFPSSTDQEDDYHAVPQVQSHQQNIQGHVSRFLNPSVARLQQYRTLEEVRENQQAEALEAQKTAAIKNAKKRLQEIDQRELFLTQCGASFTGKGNRVCDNNRDSGSSRRAEAIERKQVEINKAAAERNAKAAEERLKKLFEKEKEINEWKKMENQISQVSVEEMPMPGSTTNEIDCSSLNQNRISLVEEQNREYQRCLEIDGHFFKARAIQERKKQEEETFRKNKEQMIRNAVENANRDLPIEPDSHESDIITIRIRFPAGTAEIRRFRYEEPIKNLIKYVTSKGYATVNHHIFTNDSPKREIASKFDVEKSFRDQGWSPRECVLVEQFSE